MFTVTTDPSVSWTPVFVQFIPSVDVQTYLSVESVEIIQFIAAPSGDLYTCAEFAPYPPGFAV